MRWGCVSRRLGTCGFIDLAPEVDGEEDDRVRIVNHDGQYIYESSRPDGPEQDDGLFTG